MKSDEASQIYTLGRAQELIYELKVKEAMRAEVLTVGPDNTMMDVGTILREHKISGTPVIEDDALVGIVSIEDLFKSLRAGEMEAPVREKMSPDIVALYSDEPLIFALNQFARHGYGRFPVIDRTSKKLVGILTKGDIVLCLLKRLEMNHVNEEIRKYRPGHLFEDIGSDRSVLMMKFCIEGANFQKAGQASSRLKNNLLRIGLPPDTARRITIASYEAEMNIVVFTPGGELRASIEPTCVTVNAVDTGPGIPDVDVAMQPGYSTAPDWVRELGFGAGMGLPNIKSCSDELKVESCVGKGTNVQFTVHT